ncbi:hypothetical protein ABPG74_021152 [Tetrahymena malaccensis]
MQQQKESLKDLNGQFKSCYQRFQFKEFYAHEMIKIVSPLGLSKMTSIILLVICQLTILSFLYKNEYYYANFTENTYKNQDLRLYQVSNFIQYLQVLPFVQDYFKSTISCQSYLLLFTFTFNCLYFFSIILIIIFRQVEIKKYLQKFCQMITTIYNKWPFYFSLHLSLCLISQGDSKFSSSVIIISYFNMLLTLSIGYLVEFHDFSFSFIDSTNYLAKHYSLSGQVLMILRTFLICLNEYYSHKILAIYSSLYFCLETINSIINHQYLSSNINKIYVFLTTSSFQISICYLIQIFFINDSDIILVSILTVPLSVLLIRYIYQQNNQDLLYRFCNIRQLFQCSQKDFQKTTRLIHQLVQNNQKKLIFSDKKIAFENIINSHYQYCSAQDQNCFCYRFKKSEGNSSQTKAEEKTEKHTKKEFIENIIFYTMEKYIQNYQRNDKNENISILRLLQLNYLFEIIKDPVQVLINLQQIQQQFIKSSKMKSSQIFYFYQLKERIMKYYEDTFFDSNIENQKINMMDVIYFGDKINLCKEKLRSALILSGQFYDLLCGDFIPLKSIEDQSSPLLKLKDNLESNFVELFKINPNDLDLQYLACIYIQVLDFQNRKISDFQNEALHHLQQVLKQKNYKRNYLQQNYFSGKNCVVFSSLLKSTFSINLVSNSFSKIFGIKPDMIVGKQLNVLIPMAIKKEHNKMIQNFIDQNSMYIIEKGERNAFALDQSGFVFPISLRIKLEMLNEDVGACALIQKINNQKQYILFDEEGSITDYSKKLFRDLFHTFERKIDDSQNIFSMIPNLQEIIKRKQFQTQFCSVLIAKKQQDKKAKSQNIQDYLIYTPQYSQSNIYSLNDDVFIINFKACQNQTKINISINYIEIDNYEKETNPIKKNKIIDELNKQLIYREIHSNLNKPVNKNIDTLNSFHNNSSDRQTSQVFETNNSILYKNLQEDQKQLKASKWSSFKIHNQEVKESEQNIIINQESKEESLTKSFSELPSTNRYFKRQGFYENQYDSMDQIHQNGDNYDIAFHTSHNINESRQMGLHQMLQILGSNNNINNNNNNTIYSYSAAADNNLSHHMLPQQKQFVLSNDQLESHQMITFNSKYLIDQGNNHSDFSINLLQNDKNVLQQKCQDYKLSQNLIENNILDMNQFQKTMSESDKCLSIEENLTSKKKSKMRDFQEKEEQLQEQQNEIASVNSSKYSSEDRIKRNIIKRIQQKIFAKSLQIMVLAGFAASITLIAVTIIIYLQNLNSLDNFVDSFLKIDGAIFCFIDVFKILALSNYQYMLGTTTLIQDSLDLQNQENVVIFYQMNTVIQDYNNNLQQLVLNNNSQDQLNELQNEPFQIQIFPIQFYFSSDISKYQITTYDQSLQYTIMQYLYEIIVYVYNYAEQQESFIWGNIVEFQSRMKNLQQIVENYAQAQFNNMDKQQMQVITLVGILSFLMIFSIVPLFIYIQIKREKVMKLFGTFQPQILEFQIQLIELAIFKIDRTKMLSEIDKKTQPSIKSSKRQKSIYIKDLMDQALQLKLKNKAGQNRNTNMQQTDSLPKYIRRQQHSRNRSIASFNSLPKFNMLISFLGIISVVLLCVQPALNILQFSPFEIESNATLQDRMVFIDIFTLLIENQASHIEQIYCLNINKLPSTTYYYSYLKNLTIQNAEKISQLQNLTTNLGKQRYDQQMFDNFYKNILNQDLCLVRQNFPQYFNSNLTQATCERLFNGILKRGLILSINKVFQTFEEQMQMYTINDLNQQIDYYISFQSQYSFIDFKFLIQIISESVDAIRQYQNQSLQDYKNHLQNTLLQLLIAQVFIIALVFLIGWVTLFYSFFDSLEKTQSIFKAFHINMLYDNDYIQSYFRQLQINQKN